MGVCEDTCNDAVFADTLEFACELPWYLVRARSVTSSTMYKKASDLHVISGWLYAGRTPKILISICRYSGKRRPIILS